MRGYFSIGILNPKTEENIGTLWRHAFLFKASYIFTIGKRYKKQCSDTCSTPKHIPLYHYLDFEEFYKTMPKDCLLIGIEISNQSKNLKLFSHPERACYLLGAEDHGIPENILSKCHEKIFIETPIKHSMNVSSAGTIIMYDRFNKRRGE